MPHIACAHPDRAELKAFPARRPPYALTNEREKQLSEAAMIAFHLVQLYTKVLY